MSTNDNNTPLKGHEYDGIKEFDNPLPMWWLWTFLGAIIYSFIYVIHYHTDTKRLIADEYQADVRALERGTGPAGNDPITGDMVKAVALDQSQLEKGHAVYSRNCVACHANDGGGGIGPNLCDNSWIHGNGKSEEIAQVIQKGVLDKGMPAWGAMLGRDEVIQVAAYVATLKGKKPANPKAAQGKKVD